MFAGRLAHGFAALAVLLALGAVLFLIFWDGYAQSETLRIDPNSGEVTSIALSSQSLVESEGWGILWVLLLPVGIAVAGLMASFGRRWPSTVLLYLTTVLLTGFALVGGYTVGLFYIPAAGALLLATMAHRWRRQRAEEG